MLLALAQTPLPPVPESWTGFIMAITALIVALGTAFGTIYAIIRAGKAQTTASTSQATANANERAITSVQADVRSAGEQITAVAQAQPTPVAILPSPLPPTDPLRVQT